MSLHWEMDNAVSIATILIHLVVDHCSLARAEAVPMTTRRNIFPLGTVTAALSQNNADRDRWTRRGGCCSWDCTNSWTSDSAWHGRYCWEDDNDHGGEGGINEID